MKPYFQAHIIVVYTDMPLRQALHKPEKSSRLMYWAVELGEYDIIYEPWSSLKGQAVADFIAEFNYPEVPDQQNQQSKQGSGENKVKEVIESEALEVPLLEEAVVDLPNSSSRTKEMLRKCEEAGEKHSIMGF